MSSPQQKNSAKLIGQNFENYSSSTNQISLDGGAHDTAAAALLWTQNMATVLNQKELPANLEESRQLL